jgi:hypothetical protein
MDEVVLAGAGEGGEAGVVGAAEVGAGGSAGGGGVFGGGEVVGNVLGCVGADGGGAGFQGEVAGCSWGDEVVVFGPVGLALALAGEVGEVLPLAVVGDVVEVEQGVEVAGAGGVCPVSMRDRWPGEIPAWAAARVRSRDRWWRWSRR